MCKQVDRHYACGHYCFTGIENCNIKDPRKCFGPSGEPKKIYDPDICYHCSKGDKNYLESAKKKTGPSQRGLNREGTPVRKVASKAGK